MATILSIEDSSFERKVIANMLREADIEEYELLEAADGEEGMRKMREEQPDLVLLDMRMPGMDGVELLRDLRQEGAKTVVVSVVRDEKTIEEAMDAGAVDYVKKPIEEEELLEVVDAALEQREEQVER